MNSVNSQKPASKLNYANIRPRNYSFSSFENNSELRIKGDLKMEHLRDSEENEGENTAKSVANVSMSDRFYEIFDNGLNKKNLDYINQLLSDEQSQSKPDNKQNKKDRKVKLPSNKASQMAEEQAAFLQNSFGHQDNDYFLPLQPEDKALDQQYKSPSVGRRTTSEHIIETIIPMEKRPQGSASNNSKELPGSTHKRKNLSMSPPLKSNEKIPEEEKTSTKSPANQVFLRILDNYIDYFDQIEPSDQLKIREREIIPSVANKEHSHHEAPSDKKKLRDIQDFQAVFIEMKKRENYLFDKVKHYKRIAKDFETKLKEKVEKNEILLRELQRMEYHYRNIKQQFDSERLNSDGYRMALIKLLDMIQSGNIEITEFRKISRYAKPQSETNIQFPLSSSIGKYDDIYARSSSNLKQFPPREKRLDPSISRSRFEEKKRIHTDLPVTKESMYGGYTDRYIERLQNKGGRFTDPMMADEYPKIINVSEIHDDIDEFYERENEGQGFQSFSNLLQNVKKPEPNSEEFNYQKLSARKGPDQNDNLFMSYFNQK